jgi:hypothetical protein
MTKQSILEDDVQAVESYVSRVASADSIEDLQRALQADREGFEESSSSMKQWFQRLARQQDAKCVDGMSDNSAEEEFSEEINYDEQLKSNQSPDEVALMAKRCVDDVDTIIDWVETLESLRDGTSTETVIEMTAELESEHNSFKDDLSLLLGQLH